MRPGEGQALRATLASLNVSIRKQRGGSLPDEVPEILLLLTADEPPVRVDLLFAHTPFEEAAIARRCRALVGSKELWVATPDDLVTDKIIAGRMQDLADVEAIANARAAIGAPIDWAYVRRWAADFDAGHRIDSFTGDEDA